MTEAMFGLNTDTATQLDTFWRRTLEEGLEDATGAFESALARIICDVLISMQDTPTRDDAWSEVRTLADTSVTGYVELQTTFDAIWNVLCQSAPDPDPVWTPDDGAEVITEVTADISTF